MASQASVDVEIYGYDFMTTDRIAREVQQVMDKMKSCSGSSISREDYIPEYHVDFDREKLALHGMNVAMASSYLRSRINGTTASYYREDGEEYDITVRYAPEFRQSIEDIENIVVYNAAGNGVRIRELGTVVERLTPPTIERKNRERVVTVTGYVAPDAALGTLASEVRAAIAPDRYTLRRNRLAGRFARRPAGHIQRPAHTGRHDYHACIHCAGRPV